MTSERVVADIGKMAEHLELLDERLARLVAALEPEGEDRTRTLRRNSVPGARVGIVGKAGIGDPGDLRMVLEPLATASALSEWRCMRSGSVSMPVRIMKALKGEIEGPKSRRPSTRGGNGERDVAEDLVQHDAAIFGPGSDSIGYLPEADQSKVPPSTMMPPIELPWPPMNLVSEWTTMSAPCSIGRTR